MKVEIEYCTNCSQHSWCSHHDEYKYQLYFQKVKVAIQQSIQQGEEIEIKAMEPLQHYKKISNNLKDNKYIDERTG